MTEGRPPVTEGRLSVTEGRPPVTEGSPTVTEGRLFVTGWRPAVTDGRPPVTEGRPPMTDGKLSVTEGRPPPGILQGIGVRSETSWATPDCWSARVQTDHSLEIGSYHNAVRKHHVR